VSRRRPIRVIFAAAGVPPRAA